MVATIVGSDFVPNLVNSKGSIENTSMPCILPMIWSRSRPVAWFKSVGTSPTFAPSPIRDGGFGAWWSPKIRGVVDTKRTEDCWILRGLAARVAAERKAESIVEGVGRVRNLRNCRQLLRSVFGVNLG